MSVILGFSSLYSELSSEGVLKYLRGDVIGEYIGFGNLTFELGHKDFSIKNGQILSFSRGLIQLIQSVLVFDEVEEWVCPDQDMVLCLCPDGRDMELKILIGRNTVGEIVVDARTFAKYAGSFHRGLLRELFREHPLLRYNYSFLQTCPGAAKVAASLFETVDIISGRVWLPTLNQADQDIDGGSGVTRLDEYISENSET